MAHTTQPNTAGTTQNAMLEELASLGAQGRVSSAVFTATAEAYSAGAVIDVAREFVGIGPVAGGEVMITSATLEIAATGLQSGETSYLLELYSVTPPSAHANKAVWDLPSGDRAAHIGTINLGTPIDKGSTLKVDVDVINKQVSVPVGGSLWGELVTVGGFTATGAARKVFLHSIAV